MTTLAGLIPILATPFRADGTLDRISLERLVEFQLRAGANGVATFGLASEAFALDTQERQAVLETVLRTARALAPEVSIIAGVAATGLAPALEQSRQAVDAGADVLMVLPPFLVLPGNNQLADFYGTLASATGVPIMVQDAPATTGVLMPVPVIAAMGDLPGVDYVKIEAAPTAVKVDALARLVGNQMHILGGQNAQFLLDELARGAVGTMPACEFTDFLAPVVAAQQCGDQSAALADFTRILPLLAYGLQSGIAWAIHKEVLVDRGIIADARVRAPAVPLDQASRAGLFGLLEAVRHGSGWRISF